MNRRGVDKIEPRKPRHKGNRMTAFIHKDTLIIDCFADGQYLGRYAIDEKGQYLSFMKGRWYSRKLKRIYEETDYCFGYHATESPKFDSERDEKAARRIVKGHAGYSTLLAIEWAEVEYNEEKRERAQMRKQERIDALLSRVPMLPYDFDRWCDKAAFGGKEYLFHDKDNNKYFCTACNKYHQIKKPPKHGQAWICTRTEKEVLMEKRRQQVNQRAYVMIPQVMDEDTVVFRHFKIEKKWGVFAPHIRNIHSEEARLVYYKGRQKLEIYYGQLNDASEYRQQWWDSNHKNKRLRGQYCYPVGIEDILKDTPYENLGIEQAAAKGWQADYNLVMAGGCSFMEYIAKSNLVRLYKELSKCMSVWGGVWVKGKGCTIYGNGQTAREVLNINMQRFHRLKQRNGGLVYLSWLQYEEETGSRVPEEVIRFMEESKIKPSELDFIKDRMSPVQAMNYIKRQAEESGRTPHALLETWKDYLSMAKKLELDTNDAIIYRAKKLIQRHDECVKELNDRADDSMMKELEKQYPRVKGIYQSIKEKYAYQDETYTIVVPDGIRDIILEGRQLHHCVASSERYFERIESGESIILFLRKTKEPLHSYYTLEVEPGGVIRQKRTEYDRQKPDIRNAEKFLKKWQQEIKKRMTGKDRKQAEKARELRQQGFEELRKSGKVIPSGELEGMLLADVLEADLMEVG